MANRYRKRKIKREHTIIHGLLPILERVAEWDEVKTITPGRISRTSKAVSGITLRRSASPAGVKLIAHGNGVVQEVFLTTSRRPTELIRKLREEKVTE
jgi:hypothetical protein